MEVALFLEKRKRKLRSEQPTRVIWLKAFEKFVFWRRIMSARSDGRPKIRLTLIGPANVRRLMLA